MRNWWRHPSAAWAFLFLNGIAFDVFASVSQRNFVDPVSGDSVAPRILQQIEASTDSLKEDVTAEWKALTGMPFAFYTPETSLGAGYLTFYKFDPKEKNRISTLLTTLSYTVKNQSLLTITPKLYYDDGKRELHSNIAFSNYPTKFYGLSNAPASEPEEFKEKYLQAFLQAGVEFSDHLYLRSAIHREFREISEADSDPLLQQFIAIQGKSVSMNAFHVSLEFDDRDFPPAPFSGKWIRLLYYVGFPDRTERFYRPEVDLRFYRKLSDQWVGAVQATASDIRSSSWVPFQFLNSLGGGNRLRGIYTTELRNNSLALVQSELRYILYPRWEINGFLGVGRMATDLETLQSDRDHWVTGLGLHFLFDPQSRTKMRIELGFSDSSPKLYFLVGEAF